MVAGERKGRAKQSQGSMEMELQGNKGALSFRRVFKSHRTRDKGLWSQGTKRHPQRERGVLPTALQGGCDVAVRTWRMQLASVVARDRNLTWPHVA